MSSELPPSNNHERAKSLPPVVPPSGGHIVRLFVVPGAIVLGVVVILLGCTGVSGWFFGFARSPADCLKDMEKGNADVRWRAANDLTQVLKRDPKLAADPEIGLKVAEQLRAAVTALEAEEKAFADQQREVLKNPSHDRDGKPSKTVVPEALKSQRKYVQFLSACLGNMSVPVGVPLLTELATKETGETRSAALIRRNAVWALANLGENRKQFDRLPPEQRQKVIDQLNDVANTSSGQSAEWARKTVDGLEGKDFGVIACLAQCAKADDPDLRTLTAFALGFWKGSASENALADQTLLKLSGMNENGQGERVLLTEDD
jgi:hypothetical protein